MAYKDIVLADSPYYYLSFDSSVSGANEGSGSGMAHAAGNTTLLGSGVHSSANAMTNSGSQYRRYTITPSTVLNGSAWTAEVWFKKTTGSSTGYQEIFNIYKASNGDPNNSLTFYSSTTGSTAPAVLMKKNSGTLLTLTSNTNVTDTNWHHMALTWDGTTLRLYLDGNVVATNTASGNNNYASGNYDLWLNAYGTSAGNENFAGSTDELAFYNTTLSSTQISSHVNNTPIIHDGYTAQAMTASVATPGGTGAGNNQNLPITTDTWVYNGNTTARSSETVLVVGGGSDRRALFAMSTPTIPTGESLTSATLRVWVVDNGDATQLTTYKNTGSWTGSTWTAPAATSIGTVSISPTDGSWLDIDVTSIIADWLAGTTNNGIAISTNASAFTELDLSSNEGTNPPRLLVSSSAPVHDGYNAEVATASANMSNASVETSANAQYGAQATTASATLVNPSVSAEQFIDVEVIAEDMEAQAAFQTGQGFSLTINVNAAPSTASAETVDATVATERGPRIDAAPLTATALWKEPALVNDAPIVASEADDAYFQRVFAKEPSVWFRLGDKGSTAADRMGGLGGTYHGVQVGQYAGPDNRQSVHFDGTASIEQLEPSGTNIDETEIIANGATLEFSFRTTEANTFILAGKDNIYANPASLTTSVTSPRELFLENGKIVFKQYNWNYQNGTITSTIKHTGFRNLADGEWHHVVIKAPETDSKFTNTATSVGETAGEIWIDGTMELRRISQNTMPGFNGFPDWIGSRPSSIDGFEIGALPSSLNFIGDMSEVVFYTGLVSDHEIPRHYYDFMGWTPVEAEPVEAFAFMTNGNRGKGNQKRALVLWWYDGHDGYSIGGDGWNNKMNFEPVIEHGATDFAGYKLFWYKTQGSPIAYRDAVTDQQTLINLETDLDIEDYDVIMFKDWPDEGAEFDTINQIWPGSYERLLNQLRWANDKGIGLFVTHPRLAVDLGIIDRVEFVPTLEENTYISAQGNARGLYDYGSAVKFPWNITGDAGLEGWFGLGSLFNGEPMNTDPAFLSNKAFYYGDTNKNDRFRVRAVVEGLTNIPSYMIQDAIYQKDYDNWGWQSAAYKYLHRLDGLQIGDEYIFHGTDLGFDYDAVSADFTDVRLGRWNGYYATPLANVKAGTVVTTFGSTLWKGKEQVDNPYKDYATTIILNPGDSLKGRAVGGKIYVNFTEQPSRQPDSVAIQVLPENDEDFPNTYKPDTDAQREWEWSETRKSLRTTTEVVVSPIVQVVMPDGTVDSFRAGRATNSTLSMTRSNNIFPIRYEISWQMNARGLWWLRERPETNEGDSIQRVEGITASAAMPSPTVVAERDADTTTAPMVALAQMPKVAEDASGEVEIRTLPATAHAEFTGFSKVVSAEPMTATAELVENFDMVHATGEQIVLTLHGYDATLYLKEDA